MLHTSFQQQNNPLSTANPLRTQTTLHMRNNNVRIYRKCRHTAGRSNANNTTYNTSIQYL